MDAIEFITSQHREVEDLFEQFEHAEDTARQAEICQKIIEDLKVHTDLEEQFFYPVVREAIPELEDEILEDLEEHHAVDLLLEEIEGMSPDDKRFEAKLIVIQEQVEHHVEEEEENLLPQVRDRLDADRLAEIGAEMQRAAESRTIADRSRDELYERAQELGVEGRSKMSKDELAEAVRSEEG